ncbi:MAG: hypothetical protein WD468_11770, partial [Pirellulales bacterium]
MRDVSKLCFAPMVVVALVLSFARNTFGATLIDDFDRNNSTIVGAASAIPSLLWDERLANGSPEIPSDTVRIVNNQLYIGNSHLVGGSGTGTSNGYAELGPFPTDLKVAFDLDFGPITSSDASGSFQRWGTETQIQLRHPDNGMMAGSALPAGSVAVSFYPNGNMHVRSASSAGLLDDRFYDFAGILQSGNGSHDTDPDTSYTMTGSHTIKMSLIGDALEIFVDDLNLPKVSTAISTSVPKLTTNQIALGKFLRTSSGVEARYDPRFDNLTIDFPLQLVVDRQTGGMTLQGATDAATGILGY